MKTTPRCPSRRHHARNRCAVGALFALLIPVSFSTGCEDAVADEFRSAALGSVESGVRSIATGLLDGLFTIAEPSSDTTTS